MTQLALARRLLDAGVWIGAIAIGISQFPELRLVSAGLLRLGGSLRTDRRLRGAQHARNFVAGVSLSVTQPVRLGDDIEFRNERGVVEDIYFTYTVVRLGDGRRLIIPNDILASEVIKNATMGGVTRVGRAEVLVPPQGVAGRRPRRTAESRQRVRGPGPIRWPARGVLCAGGRAGDPAPAGRDLHDNQAADRLVQRALARAAQARVQGGRP